MRKGRIGSLSIELIAQKRVSCVTRRFAFAQVENLISALTLLVGPLNGAKNVGRFSADYPTKVNKLNYVQAALMSFYFGNIGLRSAQAVRNLLLGHPCLGPGFAQHLYEPPVFTVIDAFGQLHIPFDRLCRNR